MATQQQLQTLDEQNRQAQAANASAVAMLVMAYYARIDSGQLAVSGSTWLDQAIAAIVAGYRRSAAMQLAYITRVRTLQSPDAPRLAPPPIPEPNLVQIRKSLTYTGLVTAAQELAKTPKAVKAEQVAAAEHTDGVSDLAQAARAAIEQAERTNKLLDARRQKILVKSAALAGGAAVRHVQNGGREETIAVVEKDLVATGYVRITRPGCCSFCAMLASRGPVYRKDSFSSSDPRFTGFGDAKVHDVCQCTLRPVYNRSISEWPDLSLDFNDLWRTSTAGLRGGKAQKAFRSAYEGSDAYKAARAAQDALTQ